MYIPDDHIKYCLGKADEIADCYTLAHLGADDPLRSIDNLRRTCEAYLKTKITTIEVEIQKDDAAAWGSYIRKPDGYDILLAQGLNYCWRRFVTCKELFHAVLDKDEYRNMNIEAHIQEVTVAFPDPESKPGGPILVEMLAEIAAMEFMFPYKRRQLALAGPDRGNFLAIAEMYKAPQVHVEKYLSASYMGNLLPFSRHN